MEQAMHLQTSPRSDAQIEASRQNGAQSHGPKSAEGKAKSSRNAFKHGLCSGKLEFESPEAEAQFDTLVVRLNQAYRPINDAEQAAIRKIAEAEWRFEVCTRMEFALLHAIDRGEACGNTGGLGLPSINTLIRYKSRIDRDKENALAEFEALKAMRPGKAAKAPEIQKKPDCTNEPKTGDGLNREMRRRLEALARKAKKRGKTRPQS